MPAYHLLDTVNNLVERIDKIVLNDYMKLFERLKVGLLQLDEVLGGYISQTEQEALLAFKVNILPPQVDPLFVSCCRL